MKKNCLLLGFLCLTIAGYSQLRMAVLGGPHSASVREENEIPFWESDIMPGYSSRTGLNLGILTEIPLSSTGSRWYIQPGLLYMEKGRKFYMRNDSATAAATDTISSSHNLGINYIEMPLNVAYKLPLNKKIRFVVSAGPYVGFFYSGKQKYETKLYSSNRFKNDENKLESGSTEGKIRTIDAGVNARAGFEIGSVVLSGFMSQGLSSFYHAPYEGTFQHRVRGVTLGIWLNKLKQPAKTAKRLQPPKDSDDDGVMDNLDKCPNIAGARRYEGCPVPDTDGDGMNDETDACPTAVGVVEFNGCPVPDMDGDGLNDLEDKCPADAGPRSNNGCPQAAVSDTVKKAVEKKMTFAAKNIFFKAGSDQLTESSIAPLDEVVQLLRDYPSINLRIEGHTDSTGHEQSNIALSRQRAESVKKYLTGKGIHESRLIASGFGSARPLQSNETLQGRRNNRRVELKVAQ